MKVEVTAKDLGILVELAELDQRAARGEPVPRETYRRSRDRAETRLPASLLDRYQTLLEAGRTPVVVAIERGSCSGCHVRLPTMLESQARRTPAVYACPHCRRMLYARELLGAEVPAAAPAQKAAPHR